jgi:hypothetical protein|tara:strand:- start:227 stop:715 length:489 start_codon:yes stop_codon:yes gene_type:complete
MEIKNTAKERLDQVEAVLDEYEGKLGIGNYSEDFHDQSVKKYMSMPRQQMEKLTVEECAEAALLLGGFSFYLQRSYNREMARVNWAASNLKKMISGREQQYSGSWDSQYYQAIKEDSYATKLDNIKTYAQQRADRLTYLATSVKNLSDLYINLQRSKINRHG